MEGFGVLGLASDRPIISVLAIGRLVSKKKPIEDE